MVFSASTLIDRLPEVRGRYNPNGQLGSSTWFRVGGTAEVSFRPVDANDFATFLKGKPADVPVTVVGVGSNLLIRDGGVPGVVVKLGREFAKIEADAEKAEVTVGAGALDINVAAVALEAGLTGLEFLSGIPGTIGGAIRMNGGAYGVEIKDVLIEAQALDPTGAIHTLPPADLGFSYRHCSVPEDWFFIGCRLKGVPGDKEAIAARMGEIRSERENSQPVRTRTGGSTFANPEGKKAWELIDAAGCRGLTIGGAMVSDKHCNFLINTGNARARDLEMLGEEVRRRVLADSGVLLRWEIRRIGIPAEGEAPVITVEEEQGQ